jgi:ketosteroid isomerase-like protein
MNEHQNGYQNEHPHAKRLRAAISRIAAGAVEEVTHVFTKHTRWHFGGASELAGDLEGDEGLAMFRRQLQLPGLWVTPQEVLVNDDRAIVFLRVRGEHAGRKLDIIRAEVMSIRDGKVVEYWGIASDPAAQDHYLAGALQ